MVRKKSSLHSTKKKKQLDLKTAELKIIELKILEEENKLKIKELKIWEEQNKAKILKELEREVYEKLKKDVLIRAFTEKNTNEDVEKYNVKNLKILAHKIA